VRRMQKALLAVNSSNNSLKTAKKAADLYGNKLEKIIILNVLLTPIIDLKEVQCVTKECLEELKRINIKEVVERSVKILDKVGLFFENKPVEVEKVIKYGNPAEVICNLAKKNKCDLIIIADKGENKGGKFKFGCVSERVVRHAETSVLVIK